MAGSAIIGALRVVLGADTAALEKGLKDSQSSLAAFAASAAKTGAAIGGALAGLGVGLGLAIKKSIDDADKIGKMSQSIGLPVEELSRLKHAADLSDVSLESLGVSMGKLSKNMAAVAGGAQNDTAQAFKALEINVKNADGTLKSSSVVLGEIAGKFKTYEDSASKTALAMLLFGKAGAAMIPLLNSGKDGLKEMSDEADKLGIVIDGKTAKSAEAFNDNLTRMGKVKDAIILKITAGMLPAFQHMSQVMIDAAKNSDLMAAAANGIVTFLKGAVDQALTASLVFQRLGVELSALWQMISAPSWEGMKAGFAAFQAAGDETKVKFEGLKTFLGDFWKSAAATAEATAPDAGAKIAAPVVVASSIIKKQAAEAEAALKKILDAGKRTFEDTRTPMEQFSMRMSKINEQYNAGAFGADTYARAVSKAQNELVQANPAANMLGDALMSTFDKALDGGTKFGDLLKGLGKDLLKMAANAAFKALLFGPQGGMGGSGLLGGLFGGGGLPGFANGGSFVVGGAGGIDSQITAMRTTPGERVTVSKNGSAMGGGFTFAPSYQFDAGIGPADQAFIMQQIKLSEQRTRSDVTNIVRGDLARDRDALG